MGEEIAAIRFIGELRFTLANLVDGADQVAVPFERVHCQIEMCVEDEHRSDDEVEDEHNSERAHRNDRFEHGPRFQCLRD